MNEPTKSGKKSLSVVIPAFDEATNIGELCGELNDVLSRSDREWEVVLVDDGSKDGTWNKIEECVSSLGSRWRSIRLSRNYGQTIALRAGVDKARGDIVVTMDADLQNDPADIPALLKKIEDGADVASGWRKNRRDAFLSRRLPSILGNYLISALSDVKLHDFGCTLKAYRKEIIKDIPLYGEMHRLIPALADWMGAEIVEVEVNHRKREGGSSKYNLSRIFPLLIDVISLRFFYAYSSRPTHVFGMWGIVSMMLGVISAALVVYMKYWTGFNMTGNPFLIISVMLFIVGVQLIGLGLLGEVSVRTYYESLHKRPYRIKEERGG